ncbi:MAG: N-acetyltransferase [Nitrosomonas sp.]|uniref:N-acetyltransferase n=1 Tax=Nitrosomonas sp. TaxID=42353 RepID=UPI00271D6862|nr:N-acetyltransferase [Nitrosomonas sp.]MDO8894367.1 N-acetyltransferase [Nitrosomonas sp.]MDO9470381.1 N-acetyltransferase [Nitrosomonas sp.]MDP1549997.1 N-acetyltransferase [Nitrosomonas sp.]MDP1933855.1 N-acetyltransferase [Nitrosomonas sp.]MDP2225559.1 N-acetyltransferase [Nitrosomonas sp.]
MNTHDKPAGSKVTVRPVMSYRDMSKFIDVPWHIYANDPLWVPPLRLERRFHFSRFNPFFKHGEWQAWVAYQNGQPVGRISAQIDTLHRERYGADTGHFGLLECIDDSEVFAALILNAEAWLASRQTRHVSGPFNLSINQECGILVDGFDTPPVIMMPHSPRWYGRLLEEQGYLPAKDLLAYKVRVDFEIPRVMQVMINRFSSKIKLRTLQRNNFDEEMETLRDIFNDAWSDNWGFIPFTREEFAELGTSLRLLLPDEFIQIAEVDGKAAAFMVSLPNLNEVLIELNGNLFPFGWLKMIKKIRNQEIRTGRIPLMGVRKQFHNTPLGLALACLVIDAPRQAGIARGIEEVEMSWILEDNVAMRSILDSIGSEQYKRYRIYGKTL